MAAPVLFGIAFVLGSVWMLATWFTDNDALWNGHQRDIWLAAAGPALEVYSHSSPADPELRWQAAAARMNEGVQLLIANKTSDFTYHFAADEASRIAVVLASRGPVLFVLGRGRYALVSSGRIASRVRSAPGALAWLGEEPSIDWSSTSE